MSRTLPRLTPTACSWKGRSHGSPDSCLPTTSPSTSPPISPVARSAVRVFAGRVVCRTGTPALWAQGPQLVQSPAADGFVTRIFKDAAGEHKYVVFVPQAYNAGKKWPVILYLTVLASGERTACCRRRSVWARTCGSGRPRFLFSWCFRKAEDTQGRILTEWSPTSPDGKRALAILDFGRARVCDRRQSSRADRLVDGRLRHLEHRSGGPQALVGPGSRSRRRRPGLGLEPEGCSDLGLPGGDRHGCSAQCCAAIDRRDPEGRRTSELQRDPGRRPRRLESGLQGQSSLRVDAFSLDRQTGGGGGHQFAQRGDGATPSTPTGHCAGGGGTVRSGRHHSSRDLRAAGERRDSRFGPFGSAADSAQCTGRPDQRHLLVDFHSGYTFSVQFTGITYSAQLDRVWAKAYAKDRLNIQLGLRNVTLVIGQTYVRDRAARPWRGRFRL